jgi:hypothetical protein
MLRWLFGRELSREEAIRIATEFVLAEWRESTADWREDEAEWPYVFKEASLGGNYWYVTFERRTIDGLIRTDHGIQVWVRKRTGEADYEDAICHRHFDQLDRGE